MKLFLYTLIAVTVLMSCKKDVAKKEEFQVPRQLFVLASKITFHGNGVFDLDSVSVIAPVPDTSLYYHVEAKYRQNGYNSWIHVSKNPISGSSAPIPFSDHTGVSFLYNDFSDVGYYVEIGYADTTGRLMMFAADAKTEVAIQLNKDHYDYLDLLVTTHPFAVEVFDKLENNFNSERSTMNVGVSVLNK